MSDERPAPWKDSEYRGHEVRWVGSGYTVFYEGKRVGYGMSVGDVQNLVDRHCEKLPIAVSNE